MGSIKININFLRESQGLHSQLQTIEGQLDTIQSIKKISQLTRTLDKTCQTLNQMKEKTNHVFGQSQQGPLEGLEEKIIDMYGRIEEAVVSRKVSQIRAEADSIKASIADGGAVQAKTVNTLSRHISGFLKQYRPGVKDLQIINDARATANQAHNFLANKPSNEKAVCHFQFLAQQKNIRLIEEMELEPGQYEDLFDIAAMIYNGNFREAKSQFRQLPESLRRIVHQHLGELKAVAFDDELETIQALLATANQLVNNREPYPTRDQINEIFLELQDYLDAEVKNPARVALYSSQ